MPEIMETVVIVTEPFEAATVGRWGHLIAEAVALRPGRLVVDLRRSPLIDAAAIGVLLRAHRAMVGSGGTFALRGPGDRVRRNLSLARLDHVFEIDGFEIESPEAVRA